MYRDSFNQIFTFYSHESSHIWKDFQMALSESLHPYFNLNKNENKFFWQQAKKAKTFL